jgi:uncharacterized integral membrane protein
MPDVKVKGRQIHLSGRLIGGAVIAVLAIIFIAQNTERARVHILFWDSDKSVWVWFLVLFAAGFIVGSVFPWFHRRPKDNAPAQPSPQI